jgi:hypothetical protein
MPDLPLLLSLHSLRQRVLCPRQRQQLLLSTSLHHLEHWPHCGTAPMQTLAVQGHAFFVEGKSKLGYRVWTEGWTVALVGSATTTFWRFNEHFRSAFQAQSIPYFEQMTKPEPHINLRSKTRRSGHLDRTQLFPAQLILFYPEHNLLQPLRTSSLLFSVPLYETSDPPAYTEATSNCRASHWPWPLAYNLGCGASG